MKKPLKLTFIADTHYYSKTLGTTGRQYELRSGSDQKCLGETEEIINAAFEEIAKSDTDFVLIAGDITNDGERISHKEFKEKLDRLAKHKKVYLITATHDWCCDRNPRSFNGNTVSKAVPTMNPQELYPYYYDYTIRDAISKFKTHLGTYSYVVQLSDSVRLLALNDDQNGRGRAGFTEEHFKWIDRQIDLAKQDNCLLIGMEHHLLIPHINPLITGGGTCVGDREEVIKRLADRGLKYMLVGHSHIQRTDDYTSPSGNKLTEINIGSLCGYPAPMVRVTVNEDLTLSYRVEHLKEFTLNGKRIDAQSFLADHCTALLHNVLDCADKQDFADRITALQLNGEGAQRLYPLIAPFLKFVKTATVNDAFKKLKAFGLAKGIDRECLVDYGNVKITKFIDDMLLSAMDGSLHPHSRESSYYKLIMAIIEIPGKIFRKNTDAKRLVFAADAILTGGKHNNQEETI